MVLGCMSMYVCVFVSSFGEGKRLDEFLQMVFSLDSSRLDHDNFRIILSNNKVI